MPGTRTKRVHLESKQITTRPSTELSMAGDPIGHPLKQPVPSYAKSGEHSGSSKNLPEPSSGLQKGPREDFGPSAVLLHSGSLAQSRPKGCRKVLENINVQKEERQEKANAKAIDFHLISMAKTKSTRYVQYSS